MNDDPATPRAKLVERKQDWAREGRLLTGTHGEGRLPPGQKLVKDWPVLDLGIQPAVTEAQFRFDLDGLVEIPLSLDWASFRALPQVSRVSDIHCVTQWSRYDNRWDGVSMRELLARSRPKPEAKFALCHAWDGYVTNLPLSDLDTEDALLAHSWEGEPLSRQHGGPLRAVVPHLYLWKSAKWIRRIQLVAQDKPGFWEQRGYHDRGDPWKEERYG